MAACQSRYLARFVAAVEPAGEADIRCVRVAAKDSLYLANDFIPTHNTCWLAWASIWFLLTRLPCKVIQTAPSKPTLQDGLYAETQMWVSRLPPDIAKCLEVKGEGIELRSSPAEAFLSVRTARAETPEAIQGVHSDYCLFLLDEASGIPQQVFDASHGSMSGPARFMVLAGNPLRTTGFFNDAITTGRKEAGGLWWTRNVSCLESKRAPQEFVLDIETLYGKESNTYRTRVLGLPPLADDDTIIPLDLAQDAVGRDVVGSPVAPLIWGLDVARLGGNQSALAKRKGNLMPEPVTWFTNRDLMQLTGTVAGMFFGSEEKKRPVEIIVDSIGLGAGVVDRLKELDLPAVGINVSEHRAIDFAYWNVKAELWWRARAWFAARDCRIPSDNEFIRALTIPRIDHHSTGKLLVENKDHLARRLGQRAPRWDGAEAFILTFATTETAALYGRKRVAHNKPLKRKLAGIV